MLLIYRAALAQARGEVQATVESARGALDLAATEDHFVRGAAGGFLALAAWAAGDVEEALATFSTAVRELHSAGNLVDEQDSTVVMGDLWLAAGRPSRARQGFEQTLAAATRNGEPYPRVTADLHVGLAELDRELDDLDSAEAHLETLHRLAQLPSGTRVGVVSAEAETAHNLEHSIANAALPNLARVESGPPDGPGLGRMVRRVDVIVCTTSAAGRVQGLVRPTMPVIVDDRALNQRAIQMLGAILVRHDGDLPAARPLPAPRRRGPRPGLPRRAAARVR